MPGNTSFFSGNSSCNLPKSALGYFRFFRRMPAIREREKILLHPWQNQQNVSPKGQIAFFDINLSVREVDNGTWICTESSVNIWCEGKNGTQMCGMYSRENCTCRFSYKNGWKPVVDLKVRRNYAQHIKYSRVFLMIGLQRCGGGENWVWGDKMQLTLGKVAIFECVFSDVASRKDCCNCWNFHFFFHAHIANFTLFFFLQNKHHHKHVNEKSNKFQKKFFLRFFWVKFAIFGWNLQPKNWNLQQKSWNFHSKNCNNPYGLFPLVKRPTISRCLHIGKNKTVKYPKQVIIFRKTFRKFVCGVLVELKLSNWKILVTRTFPHSK